MTDHNLYPLSLPQEAFYYDYLLNRNDCKYSMSGALILDGDLNIEVYRNAYKYVMKQYDAMRIKFIKKGELLYQQFRQEYSCEINYLDFRNHAHPVEDAFDFILKEFKKPLPIESDDLFSEMILQTGDKKFIFAPKFHHMIYDATGKAVINQALSDTYNSLLEKGCYPELKSFSYIDFIQDDLHYRNSDSYKKSFAYWKQKLERLPEPFGFTSKKKSIKNISLHTERITLNLHRISFESILTIASDAEATTFQVILGLLATTLHRCYKRDEFIIGMPVLNRSNYKFKNTPGLFMNMMALRLHIHAEGTFKELIDSIKSDVREGYRHQRFPLRDTIRHLRRNPEFNNELFDVTIVYRKNDFSQRIGEAKIHTVTLDTEIRAESLSIEIDEYSEEENVNIFFNYNPLVFSEDEIVQFVRCFETLLIDVVHFPDKKIKELTLLNDFDRYKILYEYNSSPDIIVTEKTIIEQFEETVRRNPGASAVLCDEQVVSYEILNEQANRIADYLLANYSIQPEEIICMASERSIDAIAAMIGIMKTGAAYLPIDNEYPVERIKYIIENSGARILIKDGLEGKNFAEVVVELSEITSQNNENVGIHIRPDNLAYVIYTSGSTGKPKGVLIEHAQFMNMFVNMIGKFGVKETDRVLQFASLGFDASLIEIFQALLTGAALVIADKEQIQNTELFIRFMEEQKVTVATLPPVYLSALNKAELPFLHTLITAGEPAVASDVNFYKQFKRCMNGYGPTETSVCTSYYIAEKEKEYFDIVPIGKPSPNLKIYILDEHLEPVPVGFEGELCVSGPSLARGYLRNEELTKQKFINNPFEAGTRLYRTGDLARWTHNGNLEFLGRIDEQVKIKGNRIELGEIQTQLAKYEKIQEVTVLDIQRGESKELAAFIVSDNSIDATDLKMYLRKFLPEYMIPLHYIVIDKIPLTQNGKINKETLRKLPLTISLNKKEFKAASSEMERRLIEMFEEVLDVPHVGIDDSFFELGGESLKIARLISKIYKELKREIGFKTIYDGPTVRSIAAELEEKAVTRYEEIPVVPAKEYHALSHAQKRMWILAQSKENAAVYHMPLSLLLEGELNLPALEESLKRIVQRHESLHTVFHDINGIPYQKVLNDYTFIIGKHDVSTADNKNDAARKVIRENIIAPFDLTFDIPIRATIVKLEKEKHILLLVIHHIAGDGISIGIMMKELSGIYNSFLTRSEFKLEPLTIQYKEYCEYEKGLIESRKYDEEKQYWIKKLQSPLPVLELTYDRPRPAIKTYSGEYLFYEIDKRVSQRVIDFCKEQDASLYMVIVSLVNILLHKYTFQEEIIIGSPIAGRNHPDLENQVGFYLNTVALRNRIKSGSRFIEFLHDVKINSTEAISNSNYPFDRLIQILNLDRDTSRTPLFDVLIQLQNQNPARLKLHGVTSSLYEVDFKFNKFDMTFTFVEEDHNISFSIGYNTDLFNKARIDRAARHLTTILSSVLTNPNITIKEIDLLDDDEKEALKNISTGMRREFNTQCTIPELFEEQVRKTPDTTALVFNDHTYTYKELDERSNIIANEMRQRLEVHPDDIVGIMTSRSELMIFGILGILKAGAAYLPIDSDYPLERISFMLQESKATLLLTESNLFGIANEAAGLKKSVSPQNITILDMSNLHGSNKKKPEVNTASANLAYVIYTSGSTGNPKGVMIEHRSLHNLVLGLSDGIYDAQSGPLNIALISPFVFDASVKQIFYALLNGHCLDIVPDGIKTSGRKLLEFYKDHNIHVSDGTPIHLEMIVDELNPGSEIYLPERFVIGGQQLLSQTVKKLFEITGEHSPEIINVYGPTECCDVSTWFTITSELFLNADAAFDSMPIGKPIHNVQIYILDPNLAQVPIGMNGELCIAGEGLARGYLNRQDLTHEKFIGAGFDNKRRIYRTGDIGRYLEDGNIVLSGRADDQIKLRGFRVELNEIENCIRNYDGIHAVAVVPVGEGNIQQVAAYYCAARKIEIDDLRQFLSLHLPAYMVPSYFMELEKLPMTLNGKVDKKSLPLPLDEISIDENAFLPGDLLEEKLSEMWKELLHIVRITPADNFFKLGGHSLIAIRLVSRIHKEFSIEINIWEVFQHPTIASLAKLLRGKNPSLFNPIEKIEISDFYPLSHSQRRLWFLSRLEGQNSLYDLPAALQLKGNVNVQVLEKVFKAIIQRHESLRTYFVEIDGEPFQKIAENVDFNLDKSNYLGNKYDENKLKELAVEYFQKEFDLSKAPLLQIKLITQTENTYLLLFNMHHIISDGWSIEIMIKELEIYYNAFLNHTEVPLQPLRIQYKDYASWQNKILGEKSLEGVKKYWQKKLRKPRPLLDLPADFKRSESFSIDGDLIQYTLDNAEAKALMDISSRQNASLYIALLSAVYILLYKYTGEEDIMIGSPVAGRQHYDLENQIGFFINTLVLRNEVNPENTFQELLNKVKETLSGAFDNQIYPFDRLVDELDVERIQNRNPLFDVMVAWMVKNGMGMKLSFNGIDVSGLDFRITKSMFDLSFLFNEDEGKVTFAIEYNTSLFKRERIQRMSDHFKKLIESITSNPKEKIKHLEILPTGEKEKFLCEFNKTDRLGTVDKNVIDLFSCQAGTHKNNTALVYEEQIMTYDELDRLSNRLANHIVEHSALKKDDIVAVIVNDPLIAVASLVAVMKTGAAYLPIMPNDPPERISFILKDSNAKAVVIDSSEFDAYVKPETFIIDVRGHITDNESSLINKIESDSLSYVIYTSGSTGLPKGVMIEHGSLVNLISSLYENIYSHYHHSLHELMLSSFAFDVSLKQIFATLCYGNTLHILHKDKRLDPREIIKYIVRSKIDIADLTPSIFSVMLEEGFGEIRKPDLKELFLGSEPLPFKLVKSFYGFAHNRGIQITNFYGPTECCVESASFKFHPDMMNDDYDIAPIGKPIWNEQIYILDKYMNVCPVGVPGEICIAGKGLARQYLNDPEMTNEKFVTFPLLNGKRIYKTGDVGRTFSDGTIEFIGRIDEQVKIRGYRIELQEIEKHLRAFIKINDCAVTLIEKEGTSELAAYFTSDEAIDQGILKNHLGRSLPKYMVPSYFIQLDTIPLSGNGKVNKKLLPDPVRLQKKERTREPQDEIEILILRICANILKNDTIGLEDNFFEIGGHSLNAVKVISQIQKELNVDLALKEIFYNPVLIHIAEKVKILIAGKDTFKENKEEGTVIVPISDDELKLLSRLQFDDEE